MADTQQLADTAPRTAPAPPVPVRPPPAGRSRFLLVTIAFATGLVVGATAVVGLQSAGVSTVGSLGLALDAPTPAGAAAQERRNPTDPLRPQNRATVAPGAGSGAEAAVLGGWPLAQRDEFDGTALDPTFWRPYSGQTTGGVGRHVPGNLSVSDGTLKVTSRGYESAGMAWQPGQQYGRWEVRARAQPGVGYGAVILLWPDAEDFPVGGEIDFMEIPGAQRNEAHFVLHSGGNNSQDGTSTTGDFTQWHTYAVEWAPDHVTGFVDGQEVFRTSDTRRIPPRPMHLAIQQDIGPYGNNWIPPLDETTPDQVQLEVDWVRIYGL